MIVVELLAAKPDGDWGDIPALILHLIVPIADGVADTVDDAGGPERNPQHLDAPHERADEKAEQIDVDSEHQKYAQPVQLRQQMTLDPIVRRTASVLLEDARL